MRVRCYEASLVFVCFSASRLLPGLGFWVFVCCPFMVWGKNAGCVWLNMGLLHFLYALFVDWA